MKIKFTLLLLVMITFGKAQTLDQLKKETNIVYEAMYNLDFETVLNYSHPKLFETISREQMIIVLEQFHENRLMRARLVHPKVNFSFSEFQIIDGKTYCVIRYNNAIRTTFEKQLSSEEVETMKKGMQSVKDNAKVTYEKSRNSFLVEGKATLVAIADATSNYEWKFVNCSTSQAHLAKNILGDDVIAKLGLQLSN